jgi:hypothetical protein
MQNYSAVVDELNYFRINQEKLNLSHLLVFTSITFQGWETFLSFQNPNKFTNTLTFYRQVSVDSPTLFPQKDKNEEGLQICVQKKVIKESYLVVTGFIVVESIEKSQDETIQSSLNFECKVGFIKFH